MAGNSVGSVLHIPDDLGAKIDAIDGKLQGLQKEAEVTATVVGKAFVDMANGKGVASFSSAIQNIVTNIGAIGTAAKKAATDVNSIDLKSKGLTDMSQGASAAATDLTKLAQTIDSLSDAITNKMGNWSQMAVEVLKYRDEVEKLKEEFKELLQQGSGGGSSRGSSSEYGIDDVMSDADLFATNKTAFNDTDITTLYDKLQAAQKVLKDTTAGLTAEEQKNVTELINGIKQRIQMRQTEAKIEGNKQITIQEAEAYASQAKTINELKNAIEIYKKARANMNVTDQAGVQAAQQLSDKIAELEKRYKGATTSTQQQAKAQQQVADAAQRAAERQAEENRRAQNTTYAGAMDYAANAKTINQMTSAIKYLTAARDKENASTAAGRKRIAALNTEIKRCTITINEQTKAARTLQAAHRGLLDIGGQLMRQAALWFSVSQIKGYVKQVAQVRGEFEMAQRSLQAILNSKSDADKLFSQTLTLALQSPYKIKDLVQYTRQLAAYRIENDKLFDTTKRLADVSAGLGVDMQRVILAYGQVKAAAFLKGTEVRQFTEAGVNIYSELQEYYKEVKGLEYTTAEIVKMISSRKVTFEDVEAIFQRMTDKGGMFYNMQLIQSETLQGKMMKFQDAVDIMLNDIGKSSEGFLKGTLDGATMLLKQWKQIAAVVGLVASMFAANKFVMPLIASFGRLRNAMGYAKIEYNSLIKTNSMFVAAAKAGCRGVAVEFGKLGAAMKGALATTGIGLAIEAIAILLFRISELSKRETEAAEAATKAYNERVASLRLITEEYDRLKNAQKNASKDEGADNSQYYEDARKQFTKFLKEAKENSMEFDIDPFHLKDEELQKTFDNAIKEYKEFLYLARQMEYNYGADNEGIFGDAIDKDLQDYSLSASKFLATAATPIQETLEAMLGDDVYGVLSEEQRKMMQSLYVSFEEDKYDLAGLVNTYRKVQGVITDIKENISSNKDLSALDMMSRSISQASRAYQNLYANAQEALKEVNEWLSEEEKGIMKITDMTERTRMVKSLIDNQAVKKNWDDTIKKLAQEVAQQRFGIIFTTEERSVEHTMDWVSEYIQNFLKENEFKIRFTADGLGELPFDDLYKQAEKAYKDGQTAAKRLEQLSRGTFQGVTYDEYVKTQEARRHDFDAPERTAMQTIWDDSLSPEEVAKRVSELGQVAGQTFEEAMAEEYRNTVIFDLLNEGAIDKEVDVTKLSLEELEQAQRDVLEQRIAAGEATDKKFGFSEEKTKTGRTNDPLQERIRLLKEMSSRYEKLIQVMSEYDAAQKVLDEYDESISKSGIRPYLPDEYTPTKGKTAEGLNNLIPTATEWKDRVELLKDIAEIKTEIKFEVEEKELDRAKNAIEEAFSSLKLYETLKEAGLGDSDIQSMFKDIVTDYKGVQDAIAEATAGKEGEKWAELIREQEQKLAQEQKEQQIKDFADLVKEYKNAMSTRLQIDNWYWGEMTKMRNNENFLKADPQLQKEMLANLESKYNEKQDDAAWDEFTNSDYYTRIFDNLEGTSTRMLQSMSERIASLRDNLQNLSPAQIEKVLKAQKELDEITAKRNPFKVLQGGLIRYIATLKKREALEQEIAENNATLSTYDEQINAQSDVINEKKQAWDDAVEQSGAESEAAEEAKSLYEEQYDILQDILEAKKALTQYTDNLVKSLNEVIQLNENMKTGLASIGSWFGGASSSISSAFEALNDWGINIDISGDLGEVLGGFSKMDSAISEIVSGKIFQGTFDLIGGIGKTFGGIFGWGSKDKKLQKKIDNLSKEVSRLEREYERIEEALSLSLSTTDIRSNYEEGIANLEQQIADYEQMIEYEEGKKHTDSDAIREYQEAIEDLEDEKEDLHNEYLEMLGGISTDDFRSVAEEFAEAWIDAFNEAEDGMDALTDTFQDYLNDMLKEQVTNAAASKFIEPIETSLNELVEKWGDITQINKEDLDGWIEDSEDYLEQYNDFLEYYFDKLGITASGADSSLSALQQGIQSITEETGAALESLLNSMRFYLATQQADVAIIKTTLIGMAGTAAENTSASNPTLVELKAQTAYLKQIDARLSSVIISGTGGRGIRTYSY